MSWVSDLPALYRYIMTCLSLWTHKEEFDEESDVMIIPWDEDFRGVSVYRGMYVHEVSLIKAH